jgi:glycogen debranching enzyme
MPASEMQSEDRAEAGEQFYIRASTSPADDRTFVLMSGDTFAIFDRSGDIQPDGSGRQGIFHKETRHLSRLGLSLGGVRPILLSSTLREDNLLFAADLTNPDLTLPSGEPMAGGALHLYRTKILTESTCHDRITVHNYGEKAVDLDLKFEFEADFADIFEVRGEKRARRGSIDQKKVEDRAVRLAYAGLDGVRRETHVECNAAECVVREREISVPIHLDVQGETSLTLSVEFGHGPLALQPDRAGRSDETLHRLDARRAEGPLAEVEIETSNEQLNAWLRRSQSDLSMLLAPTPWGVYPYAGVPWFCSVFGRDGIVTALELLWLAPSIARGVLACLATTQATAADSERDAEPGKILHELRKGEMARLGEVPFGRYYGAVDATPLFIVLAVAYYERTGDLEFLCSIWPNLLAALDWIDRFGDRDGDGFIECPSPSGNRRMQQGWKDSPGSIFHRDGTPALGPIALCEVQSYLYAAKSGMVGLANDMGDPHLAEQLSAQAADLRAKFATVFWSDEMSLFAMALDGEKHPCLVRSSNAGHCLFSGIAPEQQQRKVRESLLSRESWSGWGIRTVAEGERRYNPMSYHNGSVWPHDNALIAWGLLRSQEKGLALRILSGLLDLSTAVDLRRLPELICGFARRPDKGPTLYPVACSPQAWAAGAVFMVLQACLGIEISARERRLYLHYSALPENVKHVHLSNLRVGGAILDLSFERHSESVGVNVRRRVGEIEIVGMW